MFTWHRSDICHATAVAQSMNYIVGSNSYEPASFGWYTALKKEHWSIKGNDGNTYSTHKDGCNSLPTKQQLLDRITYALDNGIPMVIPVHSKKLSEHWVTLIGKDNDDYIVVDPDGGKKIHLKDRSYELGTYADGGGLCHGSYRWTTTGSTSQLTVPQVIRNKLLAIQVNDYGCAAVLGNLYAESNLIPNNIQKMKKTKGVSNAQYTSDVDSGKKSRDTFCYDGVGYGLAQWTFHTRKQALYDLAKQRKVSIADVNLQGDLLVKEIQADSTLLKVLKTATSIRAASDSFMLRYENPKVQTEAVKKKRADFSTNYYNMFKDGSAYTTTTTSYSSAGSQVSAQGSFVYAVRTKDGKQWGEVGDDSNYAGVPDIPITDIAIKPKKGTISYRVHVKGENYLGAAHGYNWNDYDNGYAGKGLPIDDICISADSITPEYRVHIIGENDYTAWHTGGYTKGQASPCVGQFGKSIDKIQIRPKQIQQSKQLTSLSSKPIIDLSKYNEVTDWSKVKDNVEGAILKASHGKTVHTGFYEKAAYCTKLGIPFGVYCYSFAKTAAEGREEAKAILSYIHGFDLSLPVYIDSEDESIASGASEAANAFCEEIEKGGFWAGIYANQYWWKTKLKGLSSYTKWVAMYPSEGNTVPDKKPTVDAPIALWQYTEKGTIPGIKGYVDRSVRFDNLHGGCRTTDGKTNIMLAREVLDNKWGSNPSRKEKLKNAGHNAAAVQALVNLLV